MSKKVTIPTDGGNPFVIIHNGIKYIYSPGETVTVSDGVALEIEEWKRWREKYRNDDDDLLGDVVKTVNGVKPDKNGNVDLDDSFIEAEKAEIFDHLNKLAENDKVLSARMDTFTTLPEGSTTGDAELIDGRVDKDGVTHPNIGEHIRNVTGQLSEEIDGSQECNLSQFFELVNKDYFFNPRRLFHHYFQMLGGIREIELEGFDYTLPTRIRMVCRNHDSWKYRFIISQRGEDGWKDTFDTYNLDVIENTGGLTEVVATKSKTAVRMLIDFSYMIDGENYIDGMLDVDGRYNLKKTCFREYNEQILKEVSGRYTWVNGELNVFQNGARWRFNTDNNNATMVCTGYGTEDDFREFSTDILAPFSVKAQQNADGDRVKTWGYTGGNHAYADTSGTPTAKTTLIELFVNNKPVTEKSGNFRTLTLHCKQEVQAWNTCKEDGTGRAVLIEDDVYIFDGEKMNVEVKITPLETIFIGTYYAMQLALPHPYTAYGDKVVSMIGEHDDCVPEYIEGANDNFAIRMHLERVGIGNYQYNSTSFKYKTSSDKAYYHPMENSGEFTTSDILWFKGYYRIDKARL